MEEDIYMVVYEWTTKVYNRMHETRWRKLRFKKSAPD
jgi:hypothetical protein